MKTIISILLVLSVVPLFAQTYTTEEFIVTGEPTAGPPAPPGQPGQPVPPGTTTVTTTTVGSRVVPPGPASVMPPPPEAPVYVGMNKYHVVEVMGQPTYVERFRRFAGRHQGIYDEVWTYQGPGCTTYVYIKERRVLRVEYR